MIGEVENYLVVKSDYRKSFPKRDGKGEMNVYALLLDPGNGGQAMDAEIIVHPDARPPEQGSHVEGVIEPGQYGYKFKRAKAGPAPSAGASTSDGGTWKPRDPVETKRIVHQHAQKAAIAFLQLRAYLKKIDDVELQDVFNAAARIREDVEQVK